MPFRNKTLSKLEVICVNFVIKKTRNVREAIDIFFVSDNEESDSSEISGSSDEDSRSSHGQQESSKEEEGIEF